MIDRIKHLREIHDLLNYESEKTIKILDKIMCDEHLEVVEKQLSTLRSAQHATHDLIVFEEEYFKNIGLIK